MKSLPHPLSRYPGDGGASPGVTAPICAPRTCGIMDTPHSPRAFVRDSEKPKKGQEPALVVPTKQGDVLCLKRETGRANHFRLTSRNASRHCRGGLRRSNAKRFLALNFRPPELDRSRYVGVPGRDQIDLSHSNFQFPAFMKDKTHRPSRARHDRLSGLIFGRL